jgi:citrate synthase
MPLYPDGDPRGRELLARLDDLDGPSERHDVVGKVVALAGERNFPAPNVDLGLGALSFCAGMPPESGQAIATLAKVAGWLAHAMEEYGNPSRFRSRAYYVGAAPA